MRDPKLKNISGLFDKYKRTLIAPEKVVREAVVEVVRDVLQLEISAEKVSYTVSTKVVTLRLPSVLKSEILQSQDEIIIHLKGRLGPKNAPTTII